MLRRAVFFLFAAATVAPSSVLADDDLSAPQLLPASTAVFAEIPRPGEVVDWAFDHPLHQRLRELDDYQRTLQGPQYQQLLLAVKAFEGAVEMRWRPALKTLTEGGIYLAADPQTQGAAILIHSADGQKLAAVRDALFAFARLQANQSGRPDPIQAGEYRGLAAHALGMARLAIFGDWLVVTNKNELGQAVLDRYLEARRNPAAGPPSLAGDPQFQKARAARPEAALAWAYVDLAALREAGVARKLFQAPQGNPLAEFLLGGVIGLANHAPYATWSAQADPQRLAISLSLPCDPARMDESRAYYFGLQGEGAAPPLASVPETVLALSAYRDLSEFWAAAPDLFNEDVSAKFAEADGVLTTLFSGRDFGDEVLGAARPEVQLVVARQQFPQAELPAPDIKLPAFAAVFRLKDKDQVQRPLKVSFQSLIGFLNVVGSMQGQPPLELSSQERDGAEILSTSYLPPAEEEDRRRGLINYNFSPTAVFVGDRLIVSSTKALAEALAASAGQATGGQATSGQASAQAQVNTRARLNADTLRAILEDNREQLIAQNMLEKGHSREEAEKEIGQLLEILTWIDSSAVRLARRENTLRLEWSVHFAPPPDQVNE